MERHAPGASLFNHFFRRRQADDQVPQLAGVQSNLPGPILMDQGHVTSLPSQPTSQTENEHVEMLLVDPPSEVPTSTIHPAYSTSDSSQFTSLPRALTTSSYPIDSEAPESTHSLVIDDDARSDTSMPPLRYMSDSESEDDHLRHGGYDSISESEADAYDVEMTLLVDDGYLSDNEDSALPSESVSPLSSTSFVAGASSRNHQHVMVEEVEDQDQQQTNTIPSASSGQPGSSSHVETHHPPSHPHWHPHPHPHPHPQQYPHIPPQQLDGGIRLPNFPAMPSLRAQGQVEGQVPLPGLRTLFQPLIVEAVANAGERLRTARGTGGTPSSQGPAIGPGPPIVQVTFDVPVFRIPTDGQTRQQPQVAGLNAQGMTDQTMQHFAAPPLRADNPSPGTFNLAPPTPNPIPTATDAMPPLLRQIFEAAFDGEAAEPAADGPQIGAPGWAGLMGLLFGLGLGASHELNREDPARAKRLVKGLEVVNAGLVKRMRKISEGNADGTICAICWDALLEEDGTTSDTVAGEHRWDTNSDRGQSSNPESDVTNPAEPEPQPEEPLPKVIALPCSHVFHSVCLVPWFSRPKQTTCPTCRFNVDPDNLTYEPPRRPQSETRQHPQQQRPIPSQPVVPQQEGQGQQEFSFGVVPPPQEAQDGHPPPRRTIFEHTFTIPLPPPAFPLAQQAGNPLPQPQPEVRQQGPSQQGPPFPEATMDPLSPLAFQRAFHSLRRQFVPPTQHRPQPPSNGAPVQEGPAPPPAPLQPPGHPPFPGQGLQPPPQDGQRNTNGVPRFPGLFQFELPQIVRLQDGTWFWSAPLGSFPSPATAAAPQAQPRPVQPKRTWAPPPPPGLTLRQRVEQGERELGLRCDDVSCGLGPSDDEPEPTADLARVVIHSLRDGLPGCGHAFHPACLVSAERVSGWAPDSEGERERAGRSVEVSCPLCRTVGVVPCDDWEKGVHAFA